MLRHPSSSGIIFFDYNYESPDQLRGLAASIKAENPELIISVDQEGGRVQRFKQGMTILPSMRSIGAEWEKDPAAGLEASYLAGRLVAEELADLGLNTNYAPVLDLDHGMNKVIGSRSFGNNPEQVVALAKEYLRGLGTGGIMGAGKHFPGHGGVKEDTHEKLPEDSRSEQEIAADLSVFSQLKNELPAIMTAHITFPNINKQDKQPTTFSPFWLQQKLRKEMDYQGLIISDDLSMGAVKEYFEDLGEAALACINAGCDLVLLCNDVPGAEHAMQRLAEEELHHGGREKIAGLMQEIQAGAQNSPGNSDFDPHEARRRLSKLPEPQEEDEEKEEKEEKEEEQQ